MLFIKIFYCLLNIIYYYHNIIKFIHVFAIYSSNLNRLWKERKRVSRDDLLKPFWNIWPSKPWCPKRESNPHHWNRNPVPYPLGHRGIRKFSSGLMKLKLNKSNYIEKNT